MFYSVVSIHLPVVTRSLHLKPSGWLTHWLYGCGVVFFLHIPTPNFQRPPQNPPPKPKAYWKWKPVGPLQLHDILSSLKAFHHFYYMEALNLQTRARGSCSEDLELSHWGCVSFSAYKNQQAGHKGAIEALRRLARDVSFDATEWDVESAHLTLVSTARPSLKYSTTVLKCGFKGFQFRWLHDISLAATRSATYVSAVWHRIFLLWNT